MRKTLPILVLVMIFTLPLWGEEELRIVSHLPSLTEILFELGVGDKIVAVSDYVEYPPEARKLPKVGGTLNTKYERVLKLRPNLAVLDTVMTEQLDRYKQFGIRTIAVRTMVIDDVYRSIRILAEAVNRRKRGEELIKRIQGELDAVKKSHEGKSKIRTLVVIGHTPGQLTGLFAAGKGCAHDELLTIAGGENILDEMLTSYPNISKELVVEKNPEAILVFHPIGHMPPDKKEHERRLWDPLASVEAVKKGHVFILDDPSFQQPGPRMANTARAMVGALAKVRDGQP